MTVKNELSLFEELVRRIDIRIDKVNKKRDRLTSLSCAMDGERVQTSLQPDKYSDVISDICDLEADITELKAAALTLISYLDNENYKKVLKKRHLEKKSYESIGSELEYSARHIRRLEKEALNTIKYYKSIDLSKKIL